jgi:hypothetical protein
VRHDFTTDRYREVVAAAVARFTFARFGGAVVAEPIALWRHDIDFSPQRGLALARIDREMGVTATCFVQISSRYYSVFEPEIAAVVRAIASLGHDIGLHFDAAVVDGEDSRDCEARLRLEADALERIAGVPVRFFSLHNPTTLAAGALDLASYAGLVNVSYSTLRERFSYCSDSNGVWRDRSLHDLVRDNGVTRLYALTHPEWWQDTPMAPRQRIQRCIDGRAAAAERYYDDLLERHGRLNLGKVGGR